MHVETRVANGEVLFLLNGKVTGDEVKELAVILNQFLSHGSRRFVLDLASASHVDSAGLGALVRLYATVSKSGGHVELRNLESHLRNLLSITRLLPLAELPDRRKVIRAGFWVGLAVLALLAWLSLSGHTPVSDDTGLRQGASMGGMGLRKVLSQARPSRSRRRGGTALPNKRMKLTRSAMASGAALAADMERPVSSPRDQFVTVGPPWGSETTVKAGRFDDESF